MADEPRRSGRATKGQHKQDRDLPDDAAPKKKGRGKGSKNKATEEEEEQDEEEVIRCICGTYEEETDEPRAMIACDRCGAWQHNDCMGLPEDYAPDKYFCEQCRPSDHKEIVAALARGERPWEEAAARREAAKEGKKKGKKGRKPTAVKPEAPEPDEQTPAKGSQKRKAEETPTSDLKNKRLRGTPIAENGTQATPAPRKASTPPKPTPKGDADGANGSLQDIANAARRGAAQNLVQLFADQIKSAVKKGLYKLPSGSNAQDLGLQLGLQVEHALHGVLSQDDEPTDAYKAQLRAIIFNIKKNTELGLRVIKGGLSPDTLASLDPKDMASEEQQRKDAAIMKEMEKQHEIIEEQGPRIRRTHKGEEYVDEAHGVPAESSTSRAPRKASAAEQKQETKESKTKQPLSVNTSAKPKTAAELRRKSSAHFDISKVFSGVQGSPDGDTSRSSDIKQHRSPTAPGGADNDPEIDNLLKDEENESEPYSPKDFNDEGVVWRGVVNGNSLGRFHTYAKHAAGTTPEADSLRLTWAQVIPSEIQIHGRIQPQKADEYLCGLEYSQSSDLIVVFMAEPKDTQSADGFERFFKYLKNKQRYGVGMQHEIPAIKDIYLLPMDAGQPLPTFMKALETDFPDPIPERMLLVPIVIKNSELPHNLNAVGQPNIMSPSLGPGAVAQTPITPQEGQRDTPSHYSNAVPYSNPHHQGSNGHPAHQPNSHGVVPSQHYSTPALVQHPSQSAPAPAASPPAASAAARVLGPEIAASPAVQALLLQAPNVGDKEMEVVRDCIRENPRAGQDLGVLTVMLQAASTSRSAQGQAGQGTP